MYLGKRTLNFMYVIDVISVIGLIAFLVGPGFFVDTPVADFMMKYRGLMIYHCILCGLLTRLLKELHAEVSVEIKRLQNWIAEIEKKVEK